MAIGMTKLENLVNPQVMADMIKAELPNALRFVGLATLDNTLKGRAGDTLTVPAWDYIGAAEDVPEGTAIPITQMSKTEKEMKVKKAGKGVELTDESVLSGYGDPLGEAEAQLLKAIADKVDDDCIAALDGTVQTSEAAQIDVAALEAALGVYEDEDDEPAVLIMHPKDAMVLRKDAGVNFLAGTELGANRFVKGVYGETLGVQISRSRKVEEGNAYLVKAGALKILMKRDPLVEADRDIVKKSTVITADQHYGVWLYDPTKVVKIKPGE